MLQLKLLSTEDSIVFELHLLSTEDRNVFELQLLSTKDSNSGTTEPCAWTHSRHLMYALDKPSGVVLISNDVIKKYHLKITKWTFNYVAAEGLKSGLLNHLHLIWSNLDHTDSIVSTWTLMGSD